MQVFLDTYMAGYYPAQSHQGRGMNCRTPAQAFIEGLQS